MTRTFEELAEGLREGRLEYREFEREVKAVTPAPSFVRERLKHAYEKRDPTMLSHALLLALAAPDGSLTPLLCDIALEEQWQQGCQEMALEVLTDLADPASFDSLLSLCTRPALKLSDGNDWRKAVFAITALPIERSKMERALQAIAACGNDLAKEAADSLKALKR